MQMNKHSEDARVMYHLSTVSRGAAITNKIHHFVTDAVVGLLVLLTLILVK